MSVLTLSDAKAHLDISSNEWNAQLQATIDAAEAKIAGLVGPLVVGEVTERVVASGGVLALNTSAPIASLTSVTVVGGTPLDLNGLRFDDGIVETAAVTSNLRGTYDIVLTAGHSSPEADPVVPLPADLMLAIKELVRHLWASMKRGGAQRRGNQTQPAAADVMPPGYLLPNIVVSLLEGYRLPGFA